jgi:chromosome segregation ATPase
MSRYLRKIFSRQQNSEVGKPKVGEEKKVEEEKITPIKQEATKPEKFEGLQMDVFRTALELQGKLLEIDEKWGNIDKNVEELNSLISATSEMKEKQKEELEKFRKEVYSSLTSKLSNYKTKLEELNKKIGEVDAQYSKLLASFYEDVIKPYREILGEEQKLSEEVKSIENKISELSQRLEERRRLLEEYSKNPEVIKSLLSKYAVRKTPEEESVSVTELLSESADNLKIAIKMGKDLGYANQQLMPLIGAYGLLNYSYGKGVSKEAADAIGVDKKVIEDYIVRIGVYAKDSATRNQILKMMKK